MTTAFMEKIPRQVRPCNCDYKTMKLSDEREAQSPRILGLILHSSATLQKKMNKLENAHIPLKC